MKSSQVMHSFVCYPPDHTYSEDNAICSRSDAAKRRFQIYLITTLCSLCNIFTSMPSTAVYQQKSKVDIFFFFFDGLIQQSLLLIFLPFASVTQTPAYLEDVSAYYSKLVCGFLSCFPIVCSKFNGII